MNKKPWEGSFESLRIFGNLYFVGTPPASVHIVDTGEGLIMLDTGYQQSLYIVIDNIYRVGLDPHDIMQHNHTEKKATLVRSGDQRAFIDPSEWQPYNLWCIENLEKMIKKEKA